GGGSTETPSTGKGTVTASTLNIRSGPSTSNSIVGKAYKGNTVDILSSSNGWYKVKLSNGQVGWGSSDYISKGGESSGGSEGSGGGSSETNNAQAIINIAKAQLGKPYVWGAEGPNSFDCSGLVYYVYGQHGIKMPRTSREQANVGTTVSQSQLQPGDLIFSSTDGSGGVNHVGIYIGNGQMIHAPKPGDVVKTTNINSSYWQNTYVKAKRVL
ncbi:C40 family peptidase, partial [Terrisporobacter glycolicus]|uniref:C40 family peptidase n=2 Tax=Terrisporobacter glycolicus TaxID=36841 RepID=UPI003463C1B5